MQPVEGILFDKDGTLFDFHRSWSVWSYDLISELSRQAPNGAPDLADRLGFDLTARRFRDDSFVIAGSVAEIAEALAAALPGRTPADLADLVVESSASAPMVPVAPLAPLLDGLRARGFRLGVATNDAEAVARAHLSAAGVQDRFDHVVGYDSGHGAKPAPGMCLAFAEAVALDPGRVVMVGDSAHDLLAGRAAGMRCVAVLTGAAASSDLAPLADAVLRDIGDLPTWLASAGG